MYRYILIFIPIVNGFPKQRLLDIEIPAFHLLSVRRTDDHGQALGSNFHGELLSKSTELGLLGQTLKEKIESF